jgi:hypothetical protein
VKGVADKRSAFARVDLRALDRIDYHVAQRDVVGVRNVYVTLCRVATLEMDGRHEGFDATRRVLMAKGSISRNTLDKHIAILESLGLVEVERRAAGHGGDLPNRYVLVDSPDPAAPSAADPTPTVGPPSNECPSPTVGGRSTSCQPLAPLRARPDAVEKEEEGERERARGRQQDQAQEDGKHLGAEQPVAAELAERGAELTARDRLALRSALHAAPDGVDALAAAMRVRRNYGQGGKAAQRRIGDVVAVLTAEMAQSTPGRAAAERASGGRSARPARRAPGYQPETPAQRERREAKHLRVHNTAPTSLDPPTRYLQAAWDSVREALAENWATTLPLEALDLAGELLTLVTDGDDEDQQRVIVLQGDPSRLPAIAAKGDVITRFFEHALGVEGAIVELAPRPHRAGKAVAA